MKYFQEFIFGKSSWTWFCECLYKAIGDTPHLTFISDGHLGIVCGLRAFFSHSEKRTCTFHMAKNFVKNNRSAGLECNFNQAVSTFCCDEKESFLEVIKNLSGRAYKWLEDFEDLTWSWANFKSKCKVDCWNNNVCENLNNILCKIKQTPLMN